MKQFSLLFPQLLFFFIVFGFGLDANGQKYQASVQVGMNVPKALSKIPTSLSSNSSLNFNREISTQLNRIIQYKEHLQLNVGLNYSFLNNTSVFPLISMEQETTVQHIDKCNVIGTSIGITNLLFNESFEMSAFVFPSIIIGHKQIERLTCMGEIKQTQGSVNSQKFTMPLQISFGKKMTLGQSQFSLGIQAKYSPFSWDKNFNLNPFTWGLYSSYSF